MRNRIICVCGPTASGKTRLSVELAKVFDGEIISADSMQIYRGMDVGTAKPGKAEQEAVPHHLIDVCAPSEPFSVARYVELADAAAQDILSRGRIPIVTGGTMLYMDALIECGEFSGGDTDPAVREKYRLMAEEKGNDAVHEALKRVDPESAERLHPNNLKRVIRALEVYESTSMTINELNRLHKRAEPKYEAIKLGVCPVSRETLYERIESRVDQMLDEGLLEETKSLMETGSLTGTAAQAIGYKELAGYIKGVASLEECVSLLKQRTRNYAKRQLTWLRKDGSIHWIYYDNEFEFTKLLQKATEYLKNHGVQCYHKCNIMEEQL